MEEEHNEVKNKEENNEKKQESRGIEELGFSVKIYNLLKRNRINTIEELQELSDKELQKKWKIGPQIISEIRTKLEEKGELKETTDKEEQETKNIEELNFSVRTTNTLRRNGINTIEELQGLSDEELEKMKNVGSKVIDEIKSKLEEIGKSLKKDTEKTKDEQENRGIEELDFSVKIYNLLKRNGINTIEELQGLSDEQLGKMRNTGPKIISEIKSKLDKYEKGEKDTSHNEGIDITKNNAETFAKESDVVQEKENAHSSIDNVEKQLSKDEKVTENEKE